MSRQTDRQVNYKKLNSYGFTLAEILLVMTIIGIVASLTIPDLTISIQSQLFKTSAKKNFSILAQVNNNVLDDYNGTFIGKFNNAEDVVNAYSKYLNVIKTCSEGTAMGSGRCFTNYFTYLNGTAYPFMPALSMRTAGFVLSDGTHVFIYDGGGTINSCTVDGMPDVCFSIGIDINGEKGPNILGRDIITFTEYTSRGLSSDYKGTCIYPPNAGWNDVNNYGWTCFTEIIQN